MSDIPELLAAIDSRLAALTAEITALEAAKAALDGPRIVGRAPAGATDATTARRVVAQHVLAARRHPSPPSSPPRS